MAMTGTMSPSPARGQLFRYQGFETDAESGQLTCRYWLDGREFTERFTLSAGPRWRTEAAQAAARLVFLLAGVSYYKTAAPAVIDLGDTALTETELAFLREFYLQGLGEFAYRNALNLSPVFPGGTTPPKPPPLLGGSPSPQTPWAPRAGGDAGGAQTHWPSRPLRPS
jgi:UDP-N-acetyl-alpha-D-muramoyl-L-alanyl-L-glutamate epimerase